MSDLVPLIFSNKVTNPGYNGGNYGVFKTGSPPGVPLTVSLSYNSTTGNWSITSAGGSSVGTPLTGSWTTTPGTAYEFYMTAEYLSPTVGPVPGPTYNTVPIATWTPISGTTLVARMQQPTVGTQGSFVTTFTILVRKVGTTTPQVATTVTLEFEYAA